MSKIATVQTSSGDWYSVDQAGALIDELRAEAERLKAEMAAVRECADTSKYWMTLTPYELLALLDKAKDEEAPRASSKEDRWPTHREYTDLAGQMRAMQDKLHEAEARAEKAEAEVTALEAGISSQDEVLTARYNAQLRRAERLEAEVERLTEERDAALGMKSYPTNNDPSPDSEGFDGR